MIDTTTVPDTTKTEATTSKDKIQRMYDLVYAILFASTTQEIMPLLETTIPWTRLLGATMVHLHQAHRVIVERHKQGLALPPEFLHLCVQRLLDRPLHRLGLQRQLAEASHRVGPTTSSN